MEYWLDHCTLQDWNDIYSRELIQQPPAEVFLAGYFGYEPPAATSAFESLEADLGLPDYEE
jgi:hypothetical protein